MNTRVSSIMQDNVITVNVNEPVAGVENLLIKNSLSFVPVVDPLGTCFGVISAPDLIHFHAAKRNPKKERAWEICIHHKVIEVDPDTPVLEVARLMVHNAIHHVLVTEEKNLKGVVSSIDLVKKYLLGS